MAPLEVLPASGPATDIFDPLAGAGAVLAPCCGAAATELTPLEQLFATVDKAFEAEKQRGYAIGYMHQPADSINRLDSAVRAAVCDYVAAGHQDWRALARFNDAHYVRHLVCENSNMEMMLICWKRGQASRVHNHAQSHCWLNVLSGGVKELRYTTGSTPMEQEPALAPRLPGVISATMPCPLLTPSGVGSVKVGSTAYINDSRGLHAVACDDDACEEGAEGSVSLHIYAPPIRRVRLYEPEENRVTVRAPGFWTVRGVEEEHLMAASHMSAEL